MLELHTFTWQEKHGNKYWTKPSQERAKLYTHNTSALHLWVSSNTQLCTLFACNYNLLLPPTTPRLHSNSWFPWQQPLLHWMTKSTPTPFLSVYSDASIKFFFFSQILLKTLCVCVSPSLTGGHRITMVTLINQVLISQVVQVYGI